MRASRRAWGMSLDLALARRVEKAHGRGGRDDVVAHGVGPGASSRGALGAGWPHADAPRATELARGRPAGRRRVPLSGHV